MPDTLVDAYDCLLLDLDGTVFRGAEPTPNAIASLAAAGDVRQLYVTNNASRSAPEVAEHLISLGFAAEPGDVVTSAQSAARLLAEALRRDDAVLVVGTEALAAEVSAVGLTPVRSFDKAPRAVVQGHSPETCWAILAEAALAIRAGAYWVAANVDATLPTERGLLPGNGSMVAALRTATDADPVVAGKPGRALMEDALARGSFARPLVVGDRLDTDIAGANAAGLPSLMVLTGVNSAIDAIWAEVTHRPRFLGTDLSSLHLPEADARIELKASWQVTVDADQISVSALNDSGSSLSLAQSLAAAVWATGAAPAVRPIVATDDHTEEVLRQLSAG
ncbi:HAD-IIA family hydrolase [Mycobacterium sp. CBMA271]|uniref:HAD-IIA family hydrolase n=1 Tax=unclassified Mycobacteroides TaxID=2618759 RepID=UPI0012DC7F92|nr:MULTISPECIES: HAD-IIA family hydrolase [unclassified Mycobacteroides]MUM17723.1 HAD family hydrolase [Mycobacteroides sp. CBMA 326]MUM23002.1 HAD-IIA family hydrolase [Mycobacteroides sp. CBMA 271]